MATSQVIERVHASGRSDSLTAAVVMTKSDRLRYLYPVRDWLGQPPTRQLDHHQINAESRDVYAFLYSRDQTGTLAAFDAFRRCTLHFTSATGGDAGPDGTFERGIRPMRVLEPLISILAMTGVIEGEAAARVGY
jgi:hypothetical protein